MSNDFPLDLDRLRRVLDYLNIGVYITDVDRRILLWNRKAEEITGHLAADVIGLACHENVLCHTDPQGQPLCTTGLCPLNRAMRTGIESETPIVVYSTDADGGTLALETSVGPLRDDAGRIIGGIETFQNITSRIRDMELARQVQESQLPQRLPEPPGYRFEALYAPHALVGGDIYNVREIDSDRFGVLIADMQGHGVSAALATMWLQSICDDLTDMADQPCEFVRGINRRMATSDTGLRFATACYAVLDAAEGVLDYTVAGHPDPLHFHGATDTISRISGHGMPMGIDDDEVYGQDSLQMAPGDAVLLYTDGVTEVFDEGGRQLGIDGLAEILAECVTMSPHIVDTLYQRVLAGSHVIEFADDVTLLLISRLPVI